MWDDLKGTVLSSEVMTDDKDTNGTSFEFLTKEKRKPNQLKALEQQIEAAENKCEALQRQVAYMRMLYDGNLNDSQEFASEKNQEEGPPPGDVKKKKTPPRRTSPNSSSKATQLEKNPSLVQKLKQQYENNEERKENFLQRNNGLSISSSSGDSPRTAGGGAQKKKVKNGKKSGRKEGGSGSGKRTKMEGAGAAAGGGGGVGPGCSSSTLAGGGSGGRGSKGWHSTSDLWAHQQNNNNHQQQQQQRRPVHQPLARPRRPQPPPTYTIPTHASKMKRVYRRPSGQDGFDFKGIPFVAGKSINRSHNLGVKIQETLSIIKMNNPTDIMRNNQGMRPSSSYCSGSHQTTTITTSTPGRGYLTTAASTSGVVRRPSTTSQDHSYQSGNNMMNDDNYYYQQQSNSGVSTSGVTGEEMKKVLVYLQADFSNALDVFKEYKSQRSPDPEKLQVMEEILDNKEQVINVISKLYMQARGMIRQRRVQGGWRPLRSVESCSSVKLTRLLRKIQHFQNSMQGVPV